MPTVGPSNNAPGTNPTTNVNETNPATPPDSPAPVSEAPPTTIDPSLAPNAPATPGVDDAPAILQALVQADKANGEQIVDIRTAPSSQTSTQVSYKLNRLLKPGESIYFAVPAAFAGRSVSFCVLGHRQDPSMDTDPTPGDDWDDTPGLTSLQIHSHDLPAGEAWRYWGGPSSGDKGAKFAEVSGSFELENLYEWFKFGHHGAEGGGHSKQGLHPDAMRAKATGQDPVYIGEVTLKVTPAEPTELRQAVFCEGTEIGDPITGAGRTYGGGQSFGGKFPGALELRSYGGNGGEGVSKLPEGWHFANGRLEVDLQAGDRVSAVEVACGDSHPDGKTNQDGGTGTKGWSKLSMGLQKSGGSTDWFMSAENVPPQGVMIAAPTDANYVAKAGDKILIRASSDTTYVMAARLGLVSEAAPPPPDPEPEPQPIALSTSGSVAQGEWKHFGPFESSADTEVEIKMSGVANQDADLYVRKGEAPTLELYDDRPYLSGSEESSKISLAPGEKLYVSVFGYSEGDSEFKLDVVG